MPIELLIFLLIAVLFALVLLAVIIGSLRMPTEHVKQQKEREVLRQKVLKLQMAAMTEDGSNPAAKKNSTNFPIR